MDKNRAAAGLVAVTAATLVVRKVLQETGLTGDDREDAARPRVVTVAVPRDELAGRELPEPLAGWGDAIEVTFRDAPGDKGTEIVARLRDPQTSEAPEGLDGETPVQKLRSALRRAKQLIETGEVLHATEPGTARTTATNAPLKAADRLAGAEGRL